MSTKVYYLLICTAFVAWPQLLFPQKLSEKRSFFYMVKINYLKPENMVITYAMSFDNENYIKAKQDEFERNNYNQRIKSVILEGLKAVDFNATYTVFGNGQFGEYNFEKKYFPIKSWYFESKHYFKNESFGSYHKTNINHGVNIREFNSVIYMEPEKANALIKSRKKSDGSIDRSFPMQFTYSILNKYVPSANSVRFYKTYIHSITAYENETYSRVMATLTPYRDYYDKVNGIPHYNGQEVFYYAERERSSFSSTAGSVIKLKPLPSKENAKYYRIINYVEGKIDSVKDYYISGKIEMEGRYGDYCIEPHCANGLFTWYYENGTKRMEVNLTNGVMNGCLLRWENNGKCFDDTRVIKDDYINDMSPRCACSNQ